MIQLTRLNGSELGINADLIERVESTPDTVITLIDGTKFVISESTAEVIARIIDFRARVIAAAHEYHSGDVGSPIPLHLVSDSADGSVVVRSIQEP